jgi:lipoate-protein ligase B
MSLNVIDLGLMEYGQAWSLQEAYAAEIASGTRPPTLLLLEHPHVYTFGSRGQAHNLLWQEERLQQKGIAIHWVDRGGDVTYHGPGQLVGYPLFPLERVDQDDKIPRADYVGYVRRLEKTLIGALARLGLTAGQVHGATGVWVQPEAHARCRRCPPEDRRKPAKVAAIGVRVDARGISRHGFALNVDPDMEYWEGIIPCGLDEPVASLADVLSPVPSMQDTREAVIREFRETFGGV